MLLYQMRNKWIRHWRKWGDEYDKSKNIKKEIVTSFIQTASSSYYGGDEELENIMEKINEIDKKVAVIEERTKKLDDLPTKSEVKNIVIEAIESKNIPSKTEVELNISRARNAQIIWTAGIVTTAVTIAVTIITKLI